jgi:hypothetical protein
MNDNSNTMMMGDLVEGGVVLTTHPHLTTSSGFLFQNGQRLSLNPKHQIFVYFDNLQGFSCYRPFAVYNGNTLAGLHEFVLRRMPSLAGADLRCWDKAVGHYHRNVCNSVFSADATEAHFLIRPHRTI